MCPHAYGRTIIDEDGKGWTFTVGLNAPKWEIIKFVMNDDQCYIGGYTGRIYRFDKPSIINFLQGDTKADNRLSNTQKLKPSNTNVDDDRSVMVVGATGLFGSRVVSTLLSQKYIVHGVCRSSNPKAVNDIIHHARNHTSSSRMDENRFHLHHVDASLPLMLSSLLSEIKPFILINCSGPYSIDDPTSYIILEQCIRFNAHYIDLSPNRAYVLDFIHRHPHNSLDSIARDRKLSFITGVSTLPGLTSAVVRDILNKHNIDDNDVTLIDIGLSPGNKVKRGLSTIVSIFSDVGKPFYTSDDSERRYGFQGLKRVKYSDHLFHDNMMKRSASRLLSHVELPDLSVLSSKYTNAKVSII